MRTLVRTLPALACALALLSPASAQPPDRKPPEDSAKKKKDYSKSPLVTRMMAFDKNKDGKLTRDEITDPRFLRLFDRADTNKDGVVTREELMALAAKLEEEQGPGDERGGPGPGRFGGRGGRGGPGRFGGPPRPGQILPPFLQEELNLTGKQKKQLQELQKEVDAKLDQILTEKQRKQLKEMRRGLGRGGPGRFGGRGGRGGPPVPPPPDDRPPE